MSAVKNKWIGLLKELGQKIGVTQADRIVDEDGFRYVFEQYCRQTKEHRETRILGGFIRDCSLVIDFTLEIDNAHRLVSPWSLCGLFYTVNNIHIKAAVDRGQTVESTVAPIRDLAKRFPNFASQTAQYPESDNIQQPLQAIFNIFIQCVNTIGSTNEPGEITKHISNAENLMSDRARSWHDMLKIARSSDSHDDVRTNSSFSSWAEWRTPQDLSQTFSTIRSLGEPGRFGAVYEVKDNAGSHKARKLVRYRPDENRARLQQLVKKEFDIMQHLRHDHIVMVHSFHEEDEGLSIIMTPVADCDLGKFLEGRSFEPKERALVEQYVETWFGCLVSALSYAHRWGVVHQDIKPQNILVKNKQIYLSDFGSAWDSNPHETADSDYQVRGTPVYMAPEVTLHTKRDKAEDVFSLGCVFTLMLSFMAGKSTTDFWRYLDNDGEYMPCFRQRIGEVQAWLNTLTYPDGSPSMRTVSVHTSDMLEKQAVKRPKLGTLMDRLRPYVDLFCKACRS